MKGKDLKKAYVYVVITALLFGSMEVSCKIGGASLDPFQLTFLRFAIGGLLLLPFAVSQIRKSNISLTIKDFLRLALVGVVGVSVSMSMFQFSIMMCNASTVSVLICINPFFTMIFAHFTTSEKLTYQKLVILMVALIGIVFMVRPWDIQEGNSLLGLLLMIGAAFFFGLYTVLGKVVQEKIGLMAQTSISFIIGSAALLPLIFVMGRPVLGGVGENLPVVLYTGLLVTGLGYFCYFKAIDLSDASTGGFAFFLKPAIAPVMAVIVLGENILWNTVAGIGFVLAASLLNILYQKKNMERGSGDRCGDRYRKAFKGYQSPGESGFKHFSVLLPLVEGKGPDSSGVNILFELRGAKLDRQPGEICFPGGLIEEGESPLECALRETEEEIGLPKDKIEIVAKLDSVYSTAGSQIHAFLGIIDENSLKDLNISQLEVAEVFQVNIEEFKEENLKIYENRLVQKPDESFPYMEVTGRAYYPWRDGRSPVPVYQVRDTEGRKRIVWGLTGRIIKSFLEREEVRGCSK